MAPRPAFHFGADFAPRGLDLAQRRLAYLAELYDSGRWRRYFLGDADFLLMVREARAAVESWRELLAAEPVESLQSTPAIINRRATLAPPDPGDEVDAARDTFRTHDRGAWLPPVAFSRHAVVAEGDLAEA